MPPPGHSSSPEPAADRADDAQYYRRVLHELIDMGADLARQVHATATAMAGATEIDSSIAFDRIARCIRRSIALARSLPDFLADFASIPAPARTDPVQHRIAARKRIIREVEDAIQCATGDEASLQAELLDRLDGPDLDDDIDGRPVADIIADICRDLGIAAAPGTQPWKRRHPADIATLYARAAAPPGGAALMLSSARFRGK